MGQLCVLRDGGAGNGCEGSCFGCGEEEEERPGAEKGAARGVLSDERWVLAAGCCPDQLALLAGERAAANSSRVSPGPRWWKRSCGDAAAGGGRCSSRGRENWGGGNYKGKETNEGTGGEAAGRRSEGLAWGQGGGAVKELSRALLALGPWEQPGRQAGDDVPAAPAYSRRPGNGHPGTWKELGRGHARSKQPRT